MKGSCICGANSFEVEDGATALWSGYCHCTLCQRAHTAPMAFDFAVPAGTVKFEKNDTTGQLNLTENCDRYFCKNCGTRFLSYIKTYDAYCIYPQHVTEPAAEEVARLYPATGHVCYETRTLTVKDGLPKFEGLPGPDSKPIEGEE